MKILKDFLHFWKGCTPGILLWDGKVAAGTSKKNKPLDILKGKHRVYKCRGCKEPVLIWEESTYPSDLMMGE